MMIHDDFRTYTLTPCDLRNGGPFKVKARIVDATEHPDYDIDTDSGYALEVGESWWWIDTLGQVSTPHDGYCRYEAQA